MTDERGDAEEELVDYDLPGNDLDPSVVTSEQRRPLPLAVKVYGVLCLADGIVSVPLLSAFFGFALFGAITQPGRIGIGVNPTLPVVIGITGAVLAFVGSVGLIVFGAALLKNRRRHAALWSYLLIAVTVGQIAVDIMLSGIDVELVRPAIQLAILIALSATVDPSLKQERDLERRLGELQDRVAAEAGMLGRDVTGEGYIKLNFFNLFWVFMVSSMIGLVLEVVWHMVVVDPGVYQDRAGVLFGPFSPIYGFGAVLMTCALNRFYKRSWLPIFLVSAAIGGGFEYLVSWFMQMSFGAVAWDYSHVRLFGAFPDPVAVIAGGRTSTPFAIMWGVLGLVWIKWCLPRLLELINLIPWKMRYSLTMVSAVLMVLNGAMTLGALDCWFERVSGIEPSTPVEQFYADYFDDEFMARRFQSMTIRPADSSRVARP